MDDRRLVQCPHESYLEEGERGRAGDPIRPMFAARSGLPPVCSAQLPVEVLVEEPMWVQGSVAFGVDFNAVGDACIKVDALVKLTRPAALRPPWAAWLTFDTLCVAVAAPAEPKPRPSPTPAAAPPSASPTSTLRIRCLM